MTPIEEEFICSMERHPPETKLILMREMQNLMRFGNMMY